MATPVSDADSRMLRSLVAELSLEQKVSLLTGMSHWQLRGIPEIGLRPMVVSDGPAGVRGVRFEPSRPASSLPAPIGLGATWDVELVGELARALGREARSRGVDILLAPTLNLVRSPLGGRVFEFFSEDPWLAARVGTAYVAGVQGAGVGTCIKHFVANDSETERKLYDAQISESVLRELYLVPFEMCVAEARPASVMAAYNAVNGHRMTANRRLLREILKDEWGFDGVVISDWTATWSTDESALAGLDLVMPGPHGPWGARLVAAVERGRVPMAEIDDKVLRILRMARAVGTLVVPGSGPDIAFASSPPTTPENIDPALLRRAAASSFVLLRNRDGLLPLSGGARRRIALIGPGAVWPRTQGGGSAMVLAAEGPSLLQTLTAGVGGEGEVDLVAGCRPAGPVPAPAPGTSRDPVTGAEGVRLEVHADDGRVIHDALQHRSTINWWADLPDAVHAEAATIVIRSRYRAEVDGPHLIGATGLGRLAIEVDGERLAEATAVTPPELVGVLSRPPELRVPVRFERGREVEVRMVNQLPAKLEAGREVEVRIGEHASARREAGPRLVMSGLGIDAAPDEESMIAEAEAAARRAAVAVVVVGLGEDADSEGFDRDSLALPGRQDELVRRVAAANPRTVVVVNGGGPALMPWSDSVAGIVLAWLPGQAMPDALADVLLGAAEPGGRLPISLPRREEDCPVLVTEPSFGALIYSEGLLIGYRGYDRRGVDPLFCFGHGLGYTDWEYVTLGAGATELAAGDDLEVTVTVRNIGVRSGREVIQLYLEPSGDSDGPSPTAALENGRPVRTLAAFQPVVAEPGDQVSARLTVPARCFARFDEAEQGWVWPAGAWSLRAGRSSRDLRLSRPVRVR
ncbi:MAG: glycoside hydrolase family 3 C-terminal domain-containing protein [Candidatus Dormiibacterota bacterium]